MSFGSFGVRSQMKSRVVIEQLTTVTIDGEIQNTWKTLVECASAEVIPATSYRGREMKQQDRVHDQATHIVKIDFNANVTGTCRVILEDGRILEVLGIPRRDKEPNASFMFLDCLETV